MRFLWMFCNDGGRRPSSFQADANIIIQNKVGSRGREPQFRTKKFESTTQFKKVISELSQEFLAQTLKDRPSNWLRTLESTAFLAASFAHCD